MRYVYGCKQVATVYDDSRNRMEFESESVPADTKSIHNEFKLT